MLIVAVLKMRRTDAFDDDDETVIGVAVRDDDDTGLVIYGETGASTNDDAIETAVHQSAEQDLELTAARRIDNDGADKGGTTECQALVQKSSFASNGH